MCLVLVAGLASTGCETLGQCPEVAVGAPLVLGITGYLAGEEAGALAGIGAGLLVATMICNERQNQLEGPEEVERAYEEEHGEEVTEPYVVIDELALEPGSILRGETGILRGEYTVMGPPPETPAAGQVRLSREGEEIFGVPLQSVEEGRMEIMRDITPHAGMNPGEYELTVEIQNGDSIARETVPLTVVEA